jgi:hypothetical protein
MFVTALGRLEGIDAKNYASSKFEDVSPDDWYDPYVKWASDIGIVNGYSDSKFGPKNLITREQMCTIFSRFIKYKGITLGEKPVSNAFADSGKISPWSSEAVNLCRQAGLIQARETTFLILREMQVVQRLLPCYETYQYEIKQNSRKYQLILVLPYPDISSELLL